MKKFLVFITVLALIAFSGCAFAASGGHVNQDANVVTDPVVVYEPDPADVTVDDPAVTVTLEEANIDTPSGFVAADIYLPTETANKVSVMTNVKISVTGDTASTPLTISFANYTGTATTGLYAFIKAKTTSGDYTSGEFYGFACTVSSAKVLSFKVDKPEIFFSENEVVIAKVETIPSGGGSSGGCNAGYAGLLLLAAVPFFFRKK